MTLAHVAMSTSLIFGLLIFLEILTSPYSKFSRKTFVFQTLGSKLLFTSFSCCMNPFISFPAKKCFASQMQTHQSI
jgi:hypothetical protein